MDIHRKMKLYKEMFYCNVTGDRDPNHIRSDSLKIELMAGGLSWPQQEYVMELMKPNEYGEVRTSTFFKRCVKLIQHFYTMWNFLNNLY